MEVGGRVMREGEWGKGGNGNERRNFIAVEELLWEMKEGGKRGRKRGGKGEKDDEKRREG